MPLETVAPHRRIQKHTGNCSPVRKPSQPSYFKFSISESPTDRKPPVTNDDHHCHTVQKVRCKPRLRTGLSAVIVGRYQYGAALEGPTGGPWGKRPTGQGTDCPGSPVALRGRAMLVPPCGGSHFSLRVPVPHWGTWECDLTPSLSSPPLRGARRKPELCNRDSIQGSECLQEGRVTQAGWS